jgi:hypothetical protein
MVKLMTSVLVSAMASSAMAAPAPTRLPFVVDDYASARAEAERKKIPLFVEVWAPW